MFSLIRFFFLSFLQYFFVVFAFIVGSKWHFLPFAMCCELSQSLSLQSAILTTTRHTDSASLLIPMFYHKLSCSALQLSLRPANCVFMCACAETTVDRIATHSNRSIKIFSFPSHTDRHAHASPLESPSLKFNFLSSCR